MGLLGYGMGMGGMYNPYLDTLVWAVRAAWANSRGSPEAMAQLSSNSSREWTDYHRPTVLERGGEPCTA
jgi:hypothetical protein